MNADGSHDDRPKNHTGQLLENARRELGLSLEEAARRTGIPAGILGALEKNASHSSGAFHSRVFLRNYADSLGLDGRAFYRRRGTEGWIEEPSSQSTPSQSTASQDAPSQDVPTQDAPPRDVPSPNGQPPIMVEARGVYKSYGAEDFIVHALEDVSLRIEKGSLVAVMGPSGCGKTTLLNVLSGLDEIERGEIFVAGEPLHAMNDARRTGYRARHMGFVFQGFNLMPVLSAVENVELPLLVSGAGLAVARKRALEVLEQVRLADRAHHRPNQLSGGQQQRVAIARALAGEPTIVWADEPTGNLDSDTSREVLDLLLRLNRENGQTFVVVTHDPGVGELMDRIVRMEDGRIVGQAGGPVEVAPGA
ncbi:MAG: ABC-type antimicrobial peptide transport system, ATPase component [uncultured Rubrobacteraceae bacterium]|uniref:ABC-type antimicrobial peptide transport system, ATPase component n=1 Tax=uncultured Rubrobacteraceae bacterium TaxID=349277 RepID=A0A6J4QPC2_9ACTN|nr:MAG: ABC-type antimicrobial peptide transport system, ATPase component [uncultured Rubrobacteraceae bacterium]